MELSLIPSQLKVTTLVAFAAEPQKALARQSSCRGSTAWNSTAWHSTAWPGITGHHMPCNVMPCNAMQHNVMPCNTMQSHAMQCNTMQSHAMPCNAMPGDTMQRNAMHSCAFPCNAMQCCTVPGHAMMLGKHQNVGTSLSMRRGLFLHFNPSFSILFITCLNSLPGSKLSQERGLATCCSCLHFFLWEGRGWLGTWMTPACFTY